MDFVLERDQRQHDVCVNVGLFVLDFGKRFDQYLQEEAEMDHHYEIDKAVVEDNDNECLEKFGEKLDSSKMELRQAVDHLELDKRLETCFEIIEEIENEFRSFHQSNLDVTKKRQPMIEALFIKFETNLLKKFGLCELEEKDKLEERNDKFAKLKAKKQVLDKEKKEREEEEKMAAEEAEKNKDKKGGGKPGKGGKDPKKAGEEQKEREKALYNELHNKVVQIDDIGLGRKWLVSLSIEAVVKGMFGKAPEEEDEAQKLAEKEEQEKLRLEKEHKEKEEAEELAKDPKKAAAKAKEKAANQPAHGEFTDEELENINDPEDRDVEIFKTAIPDFCENDPIFNEMTFEYSNILEHFMDFRTKVISFYVDKNKHVITSRKREDKEFVNMSLILLDERLKAYYPLKGKIQTEIYLVRSGEITLHKRRYQGHTKDQLDR